MCSVEKLFTITVNNLILFINTMQYLFLPAEVTLIAGINPSITSDLLLRLIIKIIH